MRHSARTLVLMVGVTLAVATTAFTRRSTAGQFDMSKKVTVTGVIARIDHPVTRPPCTIPRCSRNRGARIPAR